MLLLERGRRYDTNPFPHNWNDPTDGWLWPIRQGLFDLKHFSQMTVIEAAAVDFGKPEKRHTNKFGAGQEGCRFCGECDIGCNFHAKNTLDFNYLKVAADRGADIVDAVRGNADRTTP